MPPYRFEGQITRKSNIWSIQDLSGILGASDVSGDLILNTVGRQPLLQANLASEQVDLVQILGESKPGGPLVPDTPIDLSYFDALDALVLYEAKQIEGSGITFDEVLTEISLRNGQISIKPFEFKLVGGKIGGTVEVAAPAAELNAALEARIRSVEINKVLTQLGVDESACGIISGEIGLIANGISPADALASADGRVELVMEDGRLNTLLLEKAGLGLGEVLAMADDEDTLEIRCLIADFKVREGTMATQTLIIDTGTAKIIGHGSIELGAQPRVDITLVQRDKDFSLLSGQAPLHVGGRINNLSIDVNEERAVFSLLTPIDIGSAEDADCRQLIEAVRQ
jgi:uncharacterized protein involved in outer membrane biogenesis